MKCRSYIHQFIIRPMTNINQRFAQLANNTFLMYSDHINNWEKESIYIRKERNESEIRLLSYQYEQCRMWSRRINLGDDKCTFSEACVLNECMSSNHNCWAYFFYPMPHYLLPFLFFLSDFSIHMRCVFIAVGQSAPIQYRTHAEHILLPPPMLLWPLSLFCSSISFVLP